MIRVAAFSVGIVLLAGTACTREAPTEPDRGEPDGPTLAFRTRVENLWRESNRLAAGKSPEETVEVELAGRLYEPPLAVPRVGREEADRSTPRGAVASDFSALKAKNAEWVLENFTQEERERVREILADAEQRRRMFQYFETLESRELWAEAHHRGYALVFVRNNGAEAGGVVITFAPTSDGWKRTNALADDDTFDVVFSAFRRGGEIFQK